MRWRHRVSPYVILGVDRGATTDEIVRAYRKLIIKFHPDRNPEATALEKFKLIREAYELLKTSTSRREYDLSSLHQSGRKAEEDYDFRTATEDEARVHFTVSIPKTRTTREQLLSKFDWKSDILSFSQFETILKLQKKLFGVESNTIDWKRIFCWMAEVAPSKGNASILIEFLLDTDAIERKRGQRWEELKDAGITDLESLKMAFPPVLGSPFSIHSSISKEVARQILEEYRSKYPMPTDILTKEQFDQILHLQETLFSNNDTSVRWDYLFEARNAVSPSRANAELLLNFLLDLESLTNGKGFRWRDLKKRGVVNAESLKQMYMSRISEIGDASVDATNENLQATLFAYSQGHPFQRSVVTEKQFLEIMRLQESLYAEMGGEIQWNRLFRTMGGVNPSVGNANLLIEYLSDLEAVRIQNGERWECLLHMGIQSADGVNRKHPPLFSSAFPFLAGGTHSECARDIIKTYRERYLSGKGKDRSKTL